MLKGLRISSCRCEAAASDVEIVLKKTFELIRVGVVQGVGLPNHALNNPMASSLHLTVIVSCLLVPCLLPGQSLVPKLVSPTAVDLQRLQGSWVGGTLSRESPNEAFVKSLEQITVSIQKDSFHFHRDTNFWFATTIELPKGKSPQQLHATIRTNAPSQGTHAIGKVVIALVKVEGETLTLATRGDGSDEPPTGFDDEKVTLYELQKVLPKPAGKVVPESK